MRVRYSLGLAALAASLVSASWASAEARSESGTRYQAVQFDKATGELTLRWTGKPPVWKAATESGGRVAYLDLEGDGIGRPQAYAPEDSFLERVLIAQYRPGKVRLAVRGSEPVRLVVNSGGERSGVLKIQAQPLNPPPGSSLVHSFYYVPPMGALVVHVLGAKPTWQVTRINGVDYLDIQGTAGKPAVLVGTPQSAAPLAGRFSLIQLAQQRSGMVRVALRSTHDRLPEPRLVRTSYQWLLIVGPPPKAMALAKPVAPADAVSASTPSPTILPDPEPEPKPVASPEFTPDPLPDQKVVLPVSEPKVSRGPNEPEYPSRILGLYLPTNLSEHYPEGGAFNVNVQSIQTLGTFWRQRLAPMWASSLEAWQWDTYRIDDQATPGSSHFRRETWLNAGVSRYLPFMGLYPQLSAGYFLRWVQVDNTIEPTAPDYIFSNVQAYHGPHVSLALQVPVWGPLALHSTVAARPLVLSVFDPLVDPLGMAFSLSGEAGVEVAWGHAVGRLGYRYEAWRRPTAGFQEQAMPVLSAGYRY